MSAAVAVGMVGSEHRALGAGETACVWGSDAASSRISSAWDLGSCSCCTVTEQALFLRPPSALGAPQNPLGRSPFSAECGHNRHVWCFPTGPPRCPGVLHGSSGPTRTSVLFTFPICWTSFSGSLNLFVASSSSVGKIYWF